ncbi:hypothetical protein [Cloacibacillus sp.]|uniref:hypothetical protein n=1 Tax=Cloacibacillus sp. TaxID=2049023 RepID=UPI0025B886D5|nr:hypothetical protein [Cloacibacillus sp.]MCC8057226.1 transposon-encoded TnpW family protein [Cloacibacillus sp.]
MEKKTVTEIQIDDTLYVVTSACSETATEPIKKKLERLILQHVSDTQSYQNSSDNRLAMCLKQSEYSTYQ